MRTSQQGRHVRHVQRPGSSAVGCQGQFRDPVLLVAAAAGVAAASFAILVACQQNSGPHCRPPARRGLCRGAVVVICSDGLDRGDPDVLAAAVERLSRLCHRLVWTNPHHRPGPGAPPAALGMQVAAPHLDLVVSGHDLRSLEELAALLPRLG
ncbi:VWA domain-containing protein [Amycolatopsis sp. H6(2020)]|nr:VWA domain-containing protein [Amycolatopsis sp. H6(2020)]